VVLAARGGARGINKLGGSWLGLDAVRERGGRAGRRCRGVRQDALRDPVSLFPSSSPSARCNLQMCFGSLRSPLALRSFGRRVQGRLDPEGVAEDGRWRRQDGGGLGAPGMRRRVGAGELLRGSFSFLDDQIPLFFLALLSATFLLALRQLQVSVHLVCSKSQRMDFFLRQVCSKMQ
jgi:hypothetical protein